MDWGCLSDWQMQKNCKKLRTVKTPHHERLITVASTLETCRTMMLATNLSLANETWPTPHWVNQNHAVYSSVPWALARYSVPEVFTIGYQKFQS